GEEFERASLCRNAVTPSRSAHRPPRSAREPAAVPPPSPSLRILFVIHDFLPDNFAGAEMHTFHQARALQAGCHSGAILPAGRGSAQPEGSIRETVYEGLKIYKMAVQPAQLVSLFRNDTATQSFAAFLEQQPFDLIHFQHLLYLGGALLETAKKKGIPTVL